MTVAEAQSESNGACREDVRSGRETLPGAWERVLVVGLPALRQAYGWSQEELARRSGLHRRTIMRIEGNEPNRPQASMQTIEALAHAFGYVQVRDLWVAVQTVVATDPETPLIVGARLRRVVQALMECTP